MRPHALVQRSRRFSNRTSGAAVAIAHSVDAFPGGTFTATSDARRMRCDAVSRRNATSEPSTRYTRGSPPGALRAGTIMWPGRKPNSIKRRAMSSGRSRWSSTPASPSGSCANVGAGTLRGAGPELLLTLICSINQYPPLRVTRQGPGVSMVLGPVTSIPDLFGRRYTEPRNIS
jgi:hypothetical protein